jgi:hypothetical protein
MIGGVTRRGFKSRADDGEAKDAQHANEFESSRGENPRPNTLVLSPLAQSICGEGCNYRAFSPLSGPAPRPRAARCGRYDYEMQTTDAARRDAPAINNRAHSATLTGRVKLTSAKAAKGATQPATSITAGRSNVQPLELQACRLLGGVAGGGCFFIKNTPTPATPSHVRATRGNWVVA